MHYLGTLLKVLNGFLIFPSIKVHHCPKEIVVFFVEDVFLIVVCLFFFKFFLSNFRVIRSFFNLFVQFLQLLLINFTQIFILIFSSIFRLGHSESQIILPKIFSLRLCYFILIFSSPNSSDFVSFSSLGTWDNL